MTHLCIVEFRVELVDPDTEVTDHEDERTQEHPPVTNTTRTPNLVRQRTVPYCHWNNVCTATETTSVLPLKQRLYSH